MQDDFYATPPRLVAEMLDATTDRDYATLLDPAAGDGRLLEAAGRRWPAAKTWAYEINAGRANSLRSAFPDWLTEEADFLSSESHVLSRGPALVLLNPPFSQRGAQAIEVSWPEGRPMPCGRAMAFVLKAAELVERLGGEIVAIVPAGALTNLRDRVARARLEERGSLAVIGESTGYAFAGVATRTAIIRWEAGSGLPAIDGSLPARAELRRLRVVRGALPVHKAVLRTTNGFLPYLHTTSISRDGRIVPKLLIRPRQCERFVTGPALIVPRVGRPTPDKLAVYREGPVVLSDCLYAVECSSGDVAVALRDSLVSDWPGLSALYGGSCAPFLRQADLSRVLADHEPRVLSHEIRPAKESASVAT